MRRSPLVACLAVALLALAPHPLLAAPNAHLGGPRLERLMLHIVNQDRLATGLPPLRPGPRLALAARGHSLDMAEHGYVSHYAPDGSSPFQRLAACRVRYRQAGENIGWERGSTRWRSTLYHIEALMMQSPEHRANVLSPAFSRVGIGIAVSGDQIYVTEDFKG